MALNAKYLENSLNKCKAARKSNFFKIIINLNQGFMLNECKTQHIIFSPEPFPKNKIRLISWHLYK